MASQLAVRAIARRPAIVWRPILRPTVRRSSGNDGNKSFLEGWYSDEMQCAAFGVGGVVTGVSMSAGVISEPKMSVGQKAAALMLFVPFSAFVGGVATVLVYMTAPVTVPLTILGGIGSLFTN